MNDPHNTNAGVDKSTPHLIRFIVLMVIAVLLVIFAIQNSHEVVIKLWFWGFHTSLALALVICLIMGFLLSLIYFYPLIRQRKKLKAEERNDHGYNEAQFKRPPY